VPKRDAIVTPPGESAEHSDNRYALFPATYWAPFAGRQLRIELTTQIDMPLALYLVF
jgi:hypothetical protein